jgi:xylan 1,4-beta-xylosidase
MRCPLGRETALAEVVWKEGWPYLKDGGIVAKDQFQGYGEQHPQRLFDYDFNSKAFIQDFMSLRTPAEYMILEDGGLRLFGSESLSSLHHQNMLVRRQMDFCFEAETCLEFQFNHFQKMAGLLYRYNEENQYYLRVAYNEEKQQNCLGILCFDKGFFSMPLGDDEIPVGNGKLYLRLTVIGKYGEFSYAKEDKKWEVIPYQLDASILSDEYAAPLGFTGAFVGMSCQDMMDKNAYADYYYFSYKVID